MAAELLAHRGQQLVGVVGFALRREALEQRGRDEGRGNAGVDRGRDGPAAFTRVAHAAAELLGLPHRLAPADVDADESYVAPGYGLPSPAGREALGLMATTEAILLDHVYTAKALAALVADVRAGKYAPGSSLVFVHTGGVPAVFAEPECVLPAGTRTGQE